MGKEKVILTVEGLNKSFGPTKAVVNMHLKIRSGEIHGLIGENGSGKSTVTSMIAGCLQPDSGKMLMEGKPHCPKNMIDGRRSGICMLLQEKGTIDHLTVAENIFLGEEDRFGTKGIINRREMNKAAVNVLTKIELQDVEPAMLIDELSFEDRKLIEAGMAMKENDLTYELICAAVDGEKTALEEILRFYDDYINALATVKGEDAQGKTYRYIDEDLKARIQLKLIKAIPKWRGTEK